MEKIKILETFKQGKINQELCEDAFFISDAYVAVIDGVTSKSDFRYEGKTTGKLAEEIIYRVFETLKGEESLQRIIEQINREYESFYQRVDFPYNRAERGLQAACVIYSSRCRQIWMIGDCQASVDGRVYLNTKKSDEILADVRSLILSIRDKEGGTEGDQEARDIILPWILKSTSYANDDTSEYGYSVLNGQEIPDRLIKTISLDDQAHEIILTSDGYPKVKETLRASEGYLEQILKDDPGCYRRYRSTKGIREGQSSFDDRTYVRFTVESEEV